jgi:hypothetical protein
MQDTKLRKAKERNASAQCSTAKVMEKEAGIAATQQRIGKARRHERFATDTGKVATHQQTDKARGMQTPSQAAAAASSGAKRERAQREESLLAAAAREREARALAEMTGIGFKDQMRCAK